MTILDTWKDSLKLFIPSNFKLFALVTLNAALRTYKIIITQLWWLFGLFFVLEIGITYFFLAYEQYVPFLKGVLLSNIYLFLFVLATRPSMHKKDFDYFWSYKKHLIYFLISMLLLLIICAELYLDVAPFSYVTLLALVPFGLLWISPVFILIALFFVDTQSTLKELGFSLYRAGKMILFNYPFLLFSHFGLMLVFHTLVYCIKQIMKITVDKMMFMHTNNLVYVVITTTIQFMLLFLCVPIVCYYTNFYTKKIHDTFDLYWGKQ